MSPYFVYILQCRDGSLYTGITTNLTRRLEEHNSSLLGARYTRGRRPVQLLYSQKYANRSQASKEEIRIKKFSREEKQVLIATKKKPPRVVTRGG